MGQTQGSRSKEKKTKVVKSQDTAKRPANPTKINTKKIKRPSHRLELKNILSPNGPFPPEILELILVHVEDNALMQATMACKLWMETSIQVFKRLYLWHICSDPQSVPENFDYVSAFISHSLAKKNMKRGVYWAEEVALTYGCRGLLGGVGFTWTCDGDQIAINFDKTNHTSYGPNTMHTEGFLYDIAKRTRQPMQYGAHLWNGKTIVPLDSNFTAWEWDTCTVVLEKGKKNNREIKIEREHKFVRPPSDDPWQSLTCPNRLMDAFPNLDKSPQILTWDRCISSGTQDYTCEVYDLNTGQQLYQRQLKLYCERIIGFYKTSAICKRKSDVTLLDLTNGNELGTLPLFHVYYVHNNKIVIAETSSPTKVSVWDLETMQRLHQLDLNDTMKHINSVDVDVDTKIAGLAFDNWKLVVSISSHTFITTVVFDMTDNFNKLTQLHSPGGQANYIKIALPSNGSIVIGERQLTVIDFNHPYLYEEIPIAFCSNKDTTLKVKQYNVDPSDLMTEAKKLLQADKIGNLMATTYFDMIGYQEFNGRVTCLSVLDRSVEYYYENIGRQGIMTKLRNWKKQFGIGSVISVTSSDPNQLLTTNRLTGRGGVMDPCVMIFETFDSDTGTWSVSQPWWPDDIIALVEQNS